MRKRILLMTLAFCMLILCLQSCKTKNISEKATESQIIIHTNSTEEETNQETPKTTKYAILYSKLFANQYQKIAKHMQEFFQESAIETICGLDSIEVPKDYTEVLIGITNRDMLKASLSQSGFKIAEENGKIFINGLNAYDTICAVKYFLETVVSQENAFQVEKDFFYESGRLNTVSCGEYLQYIDVDMRVNYTLIKDFSKDGLYTGCQGGCTDGEYFYLIKNSGASDLSAVSQVLKIDPETLEVVAQSEGLSMSHANDMTYDPIGDRLIVSWCNVDSTICSVVNPHTMKMYRNNIQAGTGFFAIAYNKATNQYAVAKSKTYDIGILDDNFQLQETLTGLVTNETKQGMDCDEYYVYYLHSPSKVQANQILVYDWNGNLINTFRVEIAKEGEHIYWYKGNFYLICQGGGTFMYRLDFNICK